MRTQAKVFLGTLARIILKTFTAAGSHPRFGIAASTVLLGLEGANAQTPALDQLTPHRVKLGAVDYMGKRAVRIVEDAQVPNGEAPTLS